LLPWPAVDADLAAFAALAMADQDRASMSVKIALVERERFADRQPARQSTTIRPRSRIASASSPAARITAMISSTVGGSAGYRSRLLRGERP
jgi:hypothetical protein